MFNPKLFPTTSKICVRNFSSYLLIVISQSYKKNLEKIDIQNGPKHVIDVTTELMEQFSQNKSFLWGWNDGIMNLLCFWRYLVEEKIKIDDIASDIGSFIFGPLLINCNLFSFTVFKTKHEIILFKMQKQSLSVKYHSGQSFMGILNGKKCFKWMIQKRMSI